VVRGTAPIDVALEDIKETGGVAPVDVVDVPETRLPHLGGVGPPAQPAGRRGIDWGAPEVAQQPNRVGLDGGPVAVSSGRVGHGQPQEGHAADVVAYRSLEVMLRVLEPWIGLRGIPGPAHLGRVGISVEKCRSHVESKDGAAMVPSAGARPR